MPAFGEWPAQAGGLEEIATIKREQLRSVAGWLRDNVATWEILERLARLNGDLHAAVLERAIAALHEAGRGEPPVTVTLLIMGSGGRGESLLHPDQDNGFILGDYPDEEHARIDPYAIELAVRFNDGLAAVGFPLCDGNIMARNPVWRKKERRWCDQLARSTLPRHPDAFRPHPPAHRRPPISG